MLVLLATGCASLVPACLSAKAALLPGATWRSNDPSPTAPLVETVPPENVPVAERRVRERVTESGPVGVGVGVSAASVLGAFLGAAAPLLGVYGTFDDPRLDPNAPPPTAEPHTVQ
jgi:hypothetical protein